MVVVVVVVVAAAAVELEVEAVVVLLYAAEGRIHDLGLVALCGWRQQKKIPLWYIAEVARDVATTETEGPASLRWFANAIEIIGHLTCEIRLYFLFIYSFSPQCLGL